MKKSSSTVSYWTGCRTGNSVRANDRNGWKADISGASFFDQGRLAEREIRPRPARAVDLGRWDDVCWAESANIRVRNGSKASAYARVKSVARLFLEAGPGVPRTQAAHVLPGAPHRTPQRKRRSYRRGSRSQTPDHPDGGLAQIRLVLNSLNAPSGPDEFDLRDDIESQLSAEFRSVPQRLGSGFGLRSICVAVEVGGF